MRFLKYFTTVVGRKNTEAVTGMVLLLFCVEHLAGNSLLLLPNPSAFRWYTDTLGHSILVRVLEVAIFILFAIHIGLGIRMRLHRRKVLKRVKSKPISPSIATRTVGWTGTVILIFLVIHLARFFVPNRIVVDEQYDLYSDAWSAFASPWYTLFYVLAMIALGFHLKHGIKSSIVSFKRVPPSLIPRLRIAAVWMAVIVPAGLGYIAAHIYLVQFIR